MHMHLKLGALATSIAAQLRAQNLRASSTQLKGWQADADAITRLAVRGLLPDGVKRTARLKLLRVIAAGTMEA